MLAEWKAKRTPDKPIRLVWVCGEVRRATRCVESKKNTRRANKARLCVWRGKASDEGCVESKKNTRLAIKARLGVWRGKASNEVSGKQK